MTLSMKLEKAKDIINKIAATLIIILAIPFALTLFTNINFSIHMLLVIMIVEIIWVIITMIWYS